MNWLMLFVQVLSRKENENMVINDLMDLIKKLFDNNYENIIIVDTSDRTEYKAVEDMCNLLKALDSQKAVLKKNK